MKIFPLFLCISIFLSPFSIYSNESKTIAAIYPQTDWDMWLLGYCVSLDDGSQWFAEKGPLDYWDWEIGDQVEIEPLGYKLDKKVFPFQENDAYEAINITRNEVELFQLIE